MTALLKRKFLDSNFSTLGNHHKTKIKPWTCLLIHSSKGQVRDLGAAAKLLQSCPTPCDPIDGSPPGSAVPGILQARTLELVAISFSNTWKWKVKVKSLSRVWLLATPWTAAYRAPPSTGFSRQEYWSGCHCLLQLPVLLDVVRLCHIPTAPMLQKPHFHPHWPVTSHHSSV